MLHTTKAIVLRTIKYGDTSIVVTMYTELFGVQSYLVNGVRSEKKSSAKANIYQPTTLLELEVYHQPNKNLQRIKEARIYFLYQSLQSVMVKNTIAIFVTELITKTISEPEESAVLFDFFENCYMHIEKSATSSLANFPILFTLQLADRLGFALQNYYTESTPVLDLQNGLFCTMADIQHGYYCTEANAKLLSEIFLSDENQIVNANLNQQKRKELLAICLQYIHLHIPHMGELKSVEILHEILS